MGGWGYFNIYKKYPCGAAARGIFRHIAPALLGRSLGGLGALFGVGLDVGLDDLGVVSFVAWALMVAAVVLTVVSGAQYFWNARHVVFGRGE